MSIRILIVEDNPSILALLGATFTRQGYLTESCRDGLEAIALLKQLRHFDLVVADEMMPNIKGSELAYFMRENELFKKIPIIILSAEANDRFFGKLLEEKVINSYYPKPFQAMSLVRMANLLLRQSDRTLK